MSRSPRLTASERRERAFAATIGAHLVGRYGASPVVDHYTPAWTVETVAGPLRVTPIGDPLDYGFVAMRFDDVARAVAFMPHEARHGNLNQFSGKWNIDGMPSPAPVAAYLTEIDRKLARVRT